MKTIKDSPKEELNEPSTEIESQENESSEPVISEEFQLQAQQLLKDANPAELEYLQNACGKAGMSSADVSMEDYGKAME